MPERLTDERLEMALKIIDGGHDIVLCQDAFFIVPFVRDAVQEIRTLRAKLKDDEYREACDIIIEGAKILRRNKAL